MNNARNQDSSEGTATGNTQSIGTDTLNQLALMYSEPSISAPQLMSSNARTGMITSYESSGNDKITCVALLHKCRRGDQRRRCI